MTSSKSFIISVSLGLLFCTIIAAQFFMPSASNSIVLKFLQIQFLFALPILFFYLQRYEMLQSVLHAFFPLIFSMLYNLYVCQTTNQLLNNNSLLNVNLRIKHYIYSLFSKIFCFACFYMFFHVELFSSCPSLQQLCLDAQ